MVELYNNYNENIATNTNWNIGVYLRLSREDEKDDYSKPSESIENQLKFLQKYVLTQGWKIKKVYKDDGFSGTNFDRPGFKKMISDIESKEINMVITKDLSRLGRDYIYTGYYIEKYFPSKNVRYIAITDNVDTFDLNNTNNDITPFKAVLNDMYAKDTSKKVRTILMTKAMNGESIKSFQPYGYMKDPKNKNKVLVDRSVSGIVVKIFEMYRAGKTKKQICDYLNENNIMTPLKYKEKTTNYKNPNKRCYIWSSPMISKILRDRIYIGDLVQHKNTKVNYKLKKNVKVDPSQHIIVPNNHEPIVDKNTFNIVQKMLDKKSNEWSYNKDGTKHLLRGLVYCSCGGKITYNKNHCKHFRCVCSSYKKVGSKFCNNTQYLKEEKLISIVLEKLRKNVNKYLDVKELNYKARNNKIKDNREEIKKQISLLEEKREKMYEDKLNQIISAEMYVKMSKELDESKKNLNTLLTDMEEKQKEERIVVDDDKIEEYIKKVLEFKNDSEIDREILLKLIDKIVIENKKVKSITYNFSIPNKEQ